MGCAPMAHLLWGEVMKYSGKDSAWIDRDRFVLSNGHACALQYTMLHLTGYQVSKDDLAQFRKIGSKTPGHPESFMTDGTYPYDYIHMTISIWLLLLLSHLSAQTLYQSERIIVVHGVSVVC